MTKYTVEYRIQTLAKNAVLEANKKPAEFFVDDIKFSQWDFNYNDGCLGDYWISKLEIEAETGFKAYEICVKKLKRIIPRLALISQCFIEYHAQPFLIKKDGSELGFFGYIKENNGTGLMFMENEKNALETLLKDKLIPEEFYYYWNDAVNTIGYSAKLLLMFSAIESLSKKSNGKKDPNLIIKILGEELNKKLFQQKTGIRHKLIHGEYFEDLKTNYLEPVHKRVIQYFNRSIFKSKLICEKVRYPQRHFFGNKERSSFFIKRKKEGTLNFKEVLNDFDENEFQSPKEHEHIIDKDLYKNF